ncbi:hypothetical protein AMPC_14240 [Anaeromyxobacter paludicola]|uniref:Doubled CXXCH motif domain-containing protein n=2 Tax=Anaeromyxobacter paludicola TaxID=2918171 RepID=A0ABN6N5N6_9BACT|nr:hypothetical protein AMPC_14240 [Anaeromyxobacter paludicola]
MAAALALLAACAHGGAGAQGGSGAPPEAPGCASCHVAGEPRLRAEVVTVCRSCHPAAHGTLQPNDPGANMACNSCHDPHGVHGLSAKPGA